jgi:hypothetical protein
MTDRTTPPKGCAIYKAAELINSSGPRQMHELFASIDFGPQHKRTYKLDHAFDIDWLRATADGLVDITEKTRQHFADQEPKEEYIGQITPARYRGDWRVSTLNPKHIPNSRGMRQDVPAWSVRPDGFSLKGVAGGEV